MNGLAARRTGESEVNKEKWEEERDGERERHTDNHEAKERERGKERISFCNNFQSAQFMPFTTCERY